MSERVCGLAGVVVAGAVKAGGDARGVTERTLDERAQPQILVAAPHRAALGKQPRVEQGVAPDRDRPGPHRAFAHREPCGKKGGEVEAPRAIELSRDALRLRAIVEDMDEPRRHRAHAGVGAYAFGEPRQMTGLPNT